MKTAEIENLKKQLGLRVRALRQAKGLSQESFAEMCDLHRTYIGAIERGERNVSLENIHRISLALGVTIPALFDFRSGG